MDGVGPPVDAVWRAVERGLFKPGVVKSMFAEHRTGQHDHGNRIWRLLNLELWQRVFIDGEVPTQESEFQHTLNSPVGRSVFPGASV